MLEQSNTLGNHIEAVKKFKLGAGQSAPPVKTMPSDAEKITCIRLLIEEAVEMADAMGINLHVKDGISLISGANCFEYEVYGDTNLVEVLDASIDIMWVGVTGPLALCGISDKLAPALEAVDSNNLLKIKNGHKCPDTGKFIKPKDHPKVDLESVLSDYTL